MQNVQGQRRGSCTLNEWMQQAGKTCQSRRNRPLESVWEVWPAGIATMVPTYGCTSDYPLRCEYLDWPRDWAQITRHCSPREGQQDGTLDTYRSARRHKSRGDGAGKVDKYQNLTGKLSQVNTRSNTRMWAMPNVMAALSNIGYALCSTPQFGWRPLLDCCPVTLPKRETRWNLLGWPKLANRSQPLVHVLYLLFNNFSDCRYVP